MNVLFMPSNIRISVESDTTVLAAIYETGLWVDAPCGGHGKCGKCRVLVTKGNSKEYSTEEMRCLSQEERNKGVRLACKMIIKEDTCVILSDIENQVNHSVEDKRVLGKDSKKCEYGLALDIGTTTVEYMVLNLVDGSVMTRDRFYNPQRKYGADVIARISAWLEDQSKVQRMSHELIVNLEERLKDKLNLLDLNPKCIRKAVVVANTAMCHFFTGRSPDKLARAPFQPDFLGGTIQFTEELGLSLADKATVEILPIVGGHIGADTVGCLTALEFDKMAGFHLLVDIGTNGEIVLKGPDCLLACSTAAGPAFEGACMTYGMCAGPGAINKVLYGANGVRFQVEGNVRPVGLSGTGIIDAVAAMLKAGIMDSTGYIKEEYCAVDPVSEQEGYCLFQDNMGGVYITRQDVRQLQLAKAAISAGIKTLLKVAEVKIQDLSGIWIAGAFGTQLNLENAMQLKLLPSLDITRYHQIGNGALLGAIKRIRNQVTMEELKSLANRVQHIELAEDKGFNQTFLDNIQF